MALNAPPIKAAIADANGNATMPWVKWFQETYTRIGAALGRSTTSIDADVSTLSTDSTSMASRVYTLESHVSVLDEGPVAPPYTVAGVPAATGNAGKTIFVSDESGGAVLAFSDGTEWRRVTDRAVIS